ncbi:MAG: NAD+ synthase [Saprospiraceae bacterium]|nr:NAD+ synthase [Saprospiraceae bacterium]HQU53714.1 NAD+ synthase [Saprospiraceae bacterium]
MRICVAQLDFHIGHFEQNTQKMLDAIQVAKDQKADLVCFSELATCGYPPRDFLEFNDFISRSNASIDRLAKAADTIAVVVGGPAVNPVVEGKDLYNAAYFLYEGEIKQVFRKALLPTYDVFDEYRYFEPGHSFTTLDFKGVRLAITICEDLWNLGNENPLYTICPMDELMPAKPQVMINISASPFAWDHAEERIHVLKANVERYRLPLFYVNHCGAQTELLFDGGSLIFSPDGMVHDELPYFKEAIRTYELSDVIAGGIQHEQSKDKNQLIHDGLVMGIGDYFRKLGFKKAILGLSGGIDSALSTVLAVRALGKENVRVLLMPSPFSSQHSVDDARALAENLGIHYDIIPIQSVYASYLDTFKPYFNDLPFNVTEENIQARIRGMLLMGFSNKFGHILLNTTNKSEMAVGYGTLYGDLCGGLSVIGDVYKTEVFALCKWINAEAEIIPWNTINKPPSAELRPNQKDSDSLPEYDILDPILYQYIEKTQGPQEIIAQGFEEKTVLRILRLVNINEFKRHQTAPVLRVSAKAFGMGRRMPIVAKYLN